MLAGTPGHCIHQRSATLLKPIGPDHHEPQTGFFGWFNRNFDKGRNQYRKGVVGVMNRSGRWLLIYAVIVVVVGLLFVRMPTSFLPEEDQGTMFIQVQTPPGAVDRIAHSRPACVAHAATVIGYGPILLGAGPSRTDAPSSDASFRRPGLSST